MKGVHKECMILGSGLACPVCMVVLPVILRILADNVCPDFCFKINAGNSAHMDSSLSTKKMEPRTVLLVLAIV